MVVYNGTRGPAEQKLFKALSMTLCAARRRLFRLSDATLRPARITYDAAKAYEARHMYLSTDQLSVAPESRFTALKSRAFSDQTDERSQVLVHNVKTRYILFRLQM
jgi:hypothetical protein